MPYKTVIKVWYLNSKLLRFCSLWVDKHEDLILGSVSRKGLQAPLKKLQFCSFRSFDTEGIEVRTESWDMVPGCVWNGSLFTNPYLVNVCIVRYVVC